MRPNDSRLTFLRVLALTVPALLAPGASLAGEATTQSFRDEHAQVRVHLGHVAEWVGQLAKQPPAEQKKTAGKVVTFLELHIQPHAEWEEQHLYPVIDRLAGTGEANRLTSTMRYEHRIVGRWIGELRAELQKPSPDYGAFSRRADNLLGLLDAHFEQEEQVLLPYADKAMSRAQFERAVGLEKAHGGSGHP